MECPFKLECHLGSRFAIFWLLVEQSGWKATLFYACPRRPKIVPSSDPDIDRAPPRYPAGPTISNPPPFILHVTRRYQTCGSFNGVPAEEHVATTPVPVSPTRRGANWAAVVITEEFSRRDPLTQLLAAVLPPYAGRQVWRKHSLTGPSAAESQPAAAVAHVKLPSD